MTREEELLQQVPTEFRSVLSYMAYERGHAWGADEVFGILQGLVAELKPAIIAFEERIRKERQ